MKNNSKLLSIFILGLGLGALILYFGNNYTIQKKEVNDQNSFNPVENSVSSPNTHYSNTPTIDELTEENVVIAYVKQHHELPDYYITKAEARKQGWVASKGNLCDVLPGRAIGGDHFSNREKNLPVGAKYFEADVNYNCGRRNSDRIVFTKQGDVYLTKDHYRSFQKK